jgi:hypothetical protein
MKIHKIFLLLAWMLVAWLFASCAQPTSNAGTATPTPTIISDTKTPAPTLTLTPNSTYTPIVLPTLSVEDAHVRLLELLSNNGDCRLPCLWGITPGKSTYQEANSIIAPLGSLSKFIYLSSSPGEVSPLYTEGDMVLRTDVAYLYPDNGIINRIGFSARQEKEDRTADGRLLRWGGIFDSTTFSKRVEYYSLAHVLSEQGMPDSVMIATSDPSSLPVGAGEFNIALFYPNQGIWVKYTTSIHSTGNIVRGCPANAHIEMNLYPSGNPDSYSSLLKETNWWVQKDWYQPIEKVTSMTLKQFYETFRQTTDKCIETPASLWATP